MWDMCDDEDVDGLEAVTDAVTFFALQRAYRDVGQSDTATATDRARAFAFFDTDG